MNYSAKWIIKKHREDVNDKMTLKGMVEFILKAKCLPTFEDNIPKQKFTTKRIKK